MWNRQRTEVLLDVENVALGHTSKMRWNPADKWVFSEQIAHPPIIGTEDFELAQATLAGRGSRPRHYALRGVMVCGLCGRRMSGKWNNDQAYYLCRFPIEYALANRITHPKNVYLREADVLGQVDDWLAEMFAPGQHRRDTRRACPGKRPSSKTPPHVTRPKPPALASPSTTPRSAATAQAWTRAGIPP